MVLQASTKPLAYRSFSAAKAAVVSFGPRSPILVEGVVYSAAISPVAPNRRSNSTNVSASVLGSMPSGTSTALAYRAVLAAAKAVLVLLREQPGHVELLLGFEDAVLDHLQRAAGAFTGAEVLHDELLVGFPVIVVRGVLLEGRQDRKGNEFLLQLGLAGAVDEGQQAFPVLAVAMPDGEEVRERRGDGLGRELDRHLPDLGLASDPSAEVQLVVRRHVRAHPFPDAVETDGSDVVLGAGVVAPADLHGHIAQVLRHLSGREDLGQGAGHPFGGGDPQATRIGAGAGDDVLDQFGTGVAQVHRD